MIDGVDTAYAHDSYPAWAKVVCGYAGGHTPHQWTAAEVAAVRRSGRHWWAIWTSLNASGTLTTALGKQDALGMIARLPTYAYPKTDPVFYDIEPAIFDRDPAGARAAISAWKANMHAAGYTKAYAYTVERQGGDWIANPDNGKPTSIPAGKVGVQYVLDRGGYDYNVFSDSLLIKIPIGDPPMTPAERKAVVDDIVNQFREGGVVGDLNTFRDKYMYPKFASLSAQVAALGNAVGQLSSGGQVIDYAQIKQIAEQAAIAALENVHIDVQP